MLSLFNRSDFVGQTNNGCESFNSELNTELPPHPSMKRLSKGLYSIVSRKLKIYFQERENANVDEVQLPTNRYIISEEKVHQMFFKYFGNIEWTKLADEFECQMDNRYSLDIRKILAKYRPVGKNIAKKVIPNKSKKKKKKSLSSKEVLQKKAMFRQALRAFARNQIE